MKPILTACVNVFEKILLPYRCIICLEKSNQTRDLCYDCQMALPTSNNTCFQCGLAFSHQNHAQRCGHCIQHSPAFDHTIVGFNYQTPIDNWLKQFKFHKQGVYARILTEIFTEKLIQKMIHHPEYRPQILIPTPLHWRRLMQRGFNQTTLITQHLSQKLHIPILHPKHVIRKKYTAPQSRLNQISRQNNIRGAFSVQNIHNFSHVAIIDDVITTGNTMNTLAQQLKHHGVSYVSVWALARAN